MILMLKLVLTKDNNFHLDGNGINFWLPIGSESPETLAIIMLLIDF